MNGLWLFGKGIENGGMLWEEYGCCLSVGFFVDLDVSGSQCGCSVGGGLGSVSFD